MYLGQKAKALLDHGKTNSVAIGIGVRQGCYISPILFNVKRRSVGKGGLERCLYLTIGKRIISIVKLADYLVVLAKNEATV